MKEFLFDSNKLGNSPNYILFEVTIDGESFVGKFTTTYINLGVTPHTKQYKFESYGTLDRYKSGSEPTIIDHVEPTKIIVMDIIDGDSYRTPTTLSEIIDLADKISKVDTSFERYVVKERLLDLFNDLSDKLAKYGEEHPKSEYDTFMAFLDEEHNTILKLDSKYLENEADNRSIMRDNVNRIKIGINQRMYSLLLRGEVK